MKFPDDSVQNFFDSWWVGCGKKELKRGALIYAFVPHVDQIPHTLIPIGRKEAEKHNEAKIEIAPLRINAPRQREALPVAALSLHEGELWVAYRAKKRPCLLIGAKHTQVDNSLRRDMPKTLTSPTLIVAPYYGVDRDGKRAGYNVKLINRIRHAEYPQFMLDSLPIGGTNQSILRFDHIQPVGLHFYAYEHSGFCLSDEAIELILDDWLQWFFLGKLPSDSFILDYRNDIVSAYD
jgi:hypothetical protein